MARLVHAVALVWLQLAVAAAAWHTNDTGEVVESPTSPSGAADAAAVNGGLAEETQAT